MKMNCRLEELRIMLAEFWNRMDLKYDMFLVVGIHGDCCLTNLRIEMFVLLRECYCIP